MMATRRGMLALAASGALGGCGFRPLYMPAETGDVASAELGAVYVPVISERSGQLLRQALQRRLEGTGDGIAKKYELVASPQIGFEQMAIQRDNSTTRYRFDAHGDWQLRLLNLQHTELTRGTSRIIDGLDIANQQFFAVSLETETAYKRIAEALADQIVLQVGIFLKRRAAA